MINAAQLRANIKDSADYLVFSRGQTYNAQKHVMLVEFEDEDDQQCITITGRVLGSRIYSTTLVVYLPDSSLVHCDCDCPYGENGDKEDMCKHVVALGLAAVDKIKKENTFFDEQILPVLKENKANKLSIVSIKKPLNERYYIGISVDYGGSVTSVDLYDMKRKSISRHYSTYDSINKADIESIQQEDNLTSDQKELLTLLSLARAEYEKYSWSAGKQKIDKVQIICLARRTDMEIKVRVSYGGRDMPLIWEKDKKLSVGVSEEQRKSSYYNNNYDRQQAYSVIQMNFPMSLSGESYAAFSGKEGLIIIQGEYIRFYPINLLLAKIVERAVKSTYRYGKDKVEINTDLLEDEYEHINEILNFCREKCAYKNGGLIKLSEHYIIENHTSKPVIIIDYQRESSRIEVCPSVDYGGVVLAVCDTSSFSKSTYHYGIMRRADLAFGVSQVVRIKENTIHIAKVDMKLEEKLFNLGIIRGNDLGIRGTGRGLFKGKKQLANFMATYLPALKKLNYEIRYLHDIPQEIINAEFKADFDIDFNKENDWLAFDLALYCGQERVQLSDIELCLKNKDSQITTKDGRILQITNPEVLKRLIELLSHFRKNEGGQYEGKTYHAPELEAMALGSPHYTAKVSKAFSSFIHEAKEGKLVQSLDIPKEFEGVLRDYQKEGIHWLHFLHQYRFAGILADDMGLGKTLQALVILSIHAVKGKPSFIIVPKTLLYNWQQEIAKFMPQLKMLTIEGAPGERETNIAQAHKYDLVITSYPSLQRDMLHYEKHKVNFNYCVLDEAQYVKNPRTKNSHTVRRVKSDYRLVLTGTPLENGVQELWAQFDFLMPGFLGSHKHFQEHIGHPIMKHGNNDALAHLRLKVKCFMLRRTKEKVLKELPAKIEQNVTCELSDEQNILYQDVLQRVRKDITEQVKKDGFAKSQIHILAGLTKLRQICNHPALVLPAKKRGSYPSAKLDSCLEIIQELRQEKRKVLVFSQFTKMLDILAKELDAKKIPYAYMTGQTQNRKEVIESFTGDPNMQVFLISTKTGGVGLNLTVADAVIIFDPWWNPQVERQAIDRTHRIGQTKSVNVYRLRTKGTIEEKIIALQERKQKLFDALVSDSKDMFKKLTWEDVKGLLMS